MIVRQTIYETRSHKPKVGGRNDRAWLVPENDEEREKMKEKRERGFLIEIRGRADWERKLEELCRTARAIDPNFKKEDPRFIRPE